MLPILPAEILIRKATLSDASEIVKVHIKCWQTNYNGVIDEKYLNALNYKDFLANRRNIIREDKGIHQVILYQNKIIGFCDAGAFYVKPNQIISAEQQKNRDEIGEIYAIYVDPEYQHKGFGNAIFQKVRKLLGEQKLIPYIIWVLEDNRVARNFYEKFGGKQVDTTSSRWGDREYRSVAYRFEQ